MPFIERNANGSIVAIHKENRGHSEYLPHDDMDVREFLSDSDPFHARRKQLSETDFQLIRSIEDVIQLLLTKNVISDDELPAEVQELLRRRTMLRGIMQDLMNDLGDF